MTGVREEIQAGLNWENEWNQRMRVAGYHAGILEIPPLHYRIFRAAHMGQMAIREQLACAIAPWLDPDNACDNRRSIEAYLS